MEDILIKGAPAEYSCSVGILDKLEEKLAARKIRRALVVTGEKSWKAIQPYFTELNSVELLFDYYQGECSLEEIDRVSQIAETNRADAVIGIGGGKVLDLAKSIAAVTGVKSVLVPTLASNCAPWTPLSVIYTKEGTMTHYTVHPASVDLLLVDPRVLLSAPLPMLIAGIGDTLAKWYEADVQISRFEDPPVALKIAHYTAKLCSDVMFENAEAAINDADRGVLSPAFVKVAETIIMVGGMVGGFGDQYGRVAGAHAIHNGMTISAESHQALHGDKVAYGVLVQLLLEGKTDEVEKLTVFYKKIGLPISLQELGIHTSWIEQIAKHCTKESETIHVLREKPILSSEVIEAMRILEEQHY